MKPVGHLDAGVLGLLAEVVERHLRAAVASPSSVAPPSSEDGASVESVVAVVVVVAAGGCEQPQGDQTGQQA